MEGPTIIIDVNNKQMAVRGIEIPLRAIAKSTSGGKAVTLGNLNWSILPELQYIDPEGKRHSVALCATLYSLGHDYPKFNKGEEGIPVKGQLVVLS